MRRRTNGGVSAPDIEEWDPNEEWETDVEPIEPLWRR